MMDSEEGLFVSVTVLIAYEEESFYINFIYENSVTHVQAVT